MSCLESISHLMTQYLKIPFNCFPFIYIFPSWLNVDLEDQRLHLSSADKLVLCKVQFFLISFTLTETIYAPVIQTPSQVHIYECALRHFSIHAQTYSIPYKSQYADNLQSSLDEILLQNTCTITPCASPAKRSSINNSFFFNKALTVSFVILHVARLLVLC